MNYWSPITVFKFFDKLRELDAEMQIQTAAVFILAAARPNITMKDIGKHLKLTQASCSRNVSALSERHTKDKAGHGLIETVLDPMDHRRKIVRLTPKGESLAAVLIELLEEEKPILRVTEETGSGG